MAEDVPPGLMGAATDLAPGTTVCMLSQGREPPPLVDPPAHLLQLPPVADRVDADIGAFDPAEVDAVLLGLSSEQHYLRLRTGPVRLQAAAALGMDPGNVFLHTQEEVFRNLVVSGRQIAHCWGIRHSPGAVRPPGIGLFVDCRALGRPVAYCLVPATPICTDYLCSIVGASLPPGFQPHCCKVGDGGVTTQEIWIEHGDTLQLCLYHSGPPNALPLSAPAQNRPLCLFFRLIRQMMGPASLRVR